MPPTPELPADLLALRDEVDRRLASYLEDALSRVTDLHAALGPAADELRTFVTGGGKRLRPLFLLTGYVAGGGDPDDVMGPALALELLHTCALLHDDVIDAAPLRRGRPTTHEVFASHHRDHGYRGDPAAFGEAVAILLGDLAFVQADEAFLSCTLEAGRVLEGMRVFTTLREEVMAGQYLDVLAAHQDQESSALALEVASLKSGRYTIARPLQLGAILAGDRATADALYALGLPMGTAFQLQDDLLGVFGAPDTTGKSVASDLAEGKRTLLVTETLARLDGDGRERFLERLGSSDLDAGDVDFLRDTIETSGGRHAVTSHVERLTAEVTRQLDARNLSEPARSWLDALQALVVGRRH